MSPALEESVLVPAGPFPFGESGDLRYVDPFRMDRFPVTVARYAVFLEETGHEEPHGFAAIAADPARREHPVTRVSWFDARAFATWQGRSLPTEEQWEKAAGGTDGFAWPWGDRFDVRRLNSRAAKQRGTTAVTRYPDGASPFGVMDMAGNVWEWTGSWFDGTGELLVLKGGCHALTKEYARVSSRHFNDPAFGNNLTGFRTVENL
ncbi:MAG: SUMF1/EgtB/PvdO family nonheme iron enzyme [Planctomycetota bacterium]